MSEYTSTGAQGKRIPDDVKLKAERMLRAGTYRIDVARACGISTYSVSKIASAHKIKTVKCPVGERWTQSASKMSVTTQPVNWAGVKASLRWYSSGFDAND